MARFEFEGIDALVGDIEKLDKQSKPIVGRTVYAGAKVVADALRKATEELPVDDTNKRVEMRKGIRTKQKVGLIKSMGISKMKEDNGVFNIKVGYDGYNEIVTPRWANGQPNVMVARSIENGTSFLPATHFIQKTLKAVKKETEKAMSEAFDEAIKQTKGD